MPMRQDCYRCRLMDKCPSDVRVSYIRALLGAMWSKRPVTCREFEEVRFRGLEGVRP